MNDTQRHPFGLPVSPLTIAVGLALLTGSCSTFYSVPADSEGVVLRFGRYTEKVSSGLHAKMPFGVDLVTEVPTQRQLKLEFGFATSGATNPDQAETDPNEINNTKSMVTGDLSSAIAEWVVQYRITEPEKYLFDVRAPGETLRDICEAAMREVVGDRTVDEVITIGRQDIEVSALEKTQALAKIYQLGVTIDQVQLKNVNPPIPVQASFNEVNRAQQERENMINVANGEYNKVVPRARGEADRQISAAEGYRFKRVNEAEGDVTAFNQVFAQYKNAPDITKARIYLETLGDVIPSVKQQVVVDDKIQSILPMLPLGTQGAVSSMAAQQ